MKRLIALLGCAMLVLFAGEAVAGGMLPTLAVKALRWADYSDASSSGISAYRDTAFLSLTDGEFDTTEVIALSDIAWGHFGAGAGTGALPVLRLMLTSSLTNADSIYYGIDGAYSPTGPWLAFASAGRVSHATGTYTQGLATTPVLGDVDAQTGVTVADGAWQLFPYIRLRIHGKEANAPLPGARPYISYYKWDGTNLAEMRGSAPKYAHKHLRWLNLAGQTTDGRYVSASYADTAYIYKSSDTTTTTTCIDTTEALDMQGVAINTLWSSGTAGSAVASGLTVGLEANAATGGTQSDSIHFYVDVGLTANGPWSESTLPTFVVRTGGAKVIAGRVVIDFSSISTVSNIARIWGAPFIRFRVKTEQSLGSGYQGAKFFVGYTPKEN